LRVPGARRARQNHPCLDTPYRWDTLVRARPSPEDMEEGSTGLYRGGRGIQRPTLRR
jgi:hypothetical protein